MRRPIAYIAGTGKGIPAKVMTNHDFAALGLETDHDWIVERTGIVERHIAGENETTCTMAADAAREAMARAGIGPGEIDCIILSTATPDRLLPSTAVDLQAELGCTRASAFDISAACTGWIYGMSVAEGGPLGRRGRSDPEPPGEAPPPMPSMFCARKTGCGQPTAPADANAVFAGGVSSAPCVPIGAPIELLPPPRPAPIGTSTCRSDSRLLRRSCG